MNDDELLIWVNTWLDSARFDKRLTEEEQDACWIVLDAVARLQEERETIEREHEDMRNDMMEEWER